MTESETMLAREYLSAHQGTAIRIRHASGYLRVSGKDHVDLLHRLTTNDLRPLKPGQGQLNIFTNDKGRVIDRVALLKFADEIHLVTSPGNGAKLTKWLDDYIFIEDVAVKDASEDVSILSAWGAKTPARLSATFNTEVAGLAAWHFQEIEWQGHRLIVQRSEELSPIGYNIIAPAAAEQALQQALCSAASPLKPCLLSDQTYDTLRIESGWQAFGKDFDEQVNPHEAGLVSLVSFTKGCFIGQEVIARLDTYEKVKKRLLGLVVEGATPAQPGAAIVLGNEEIGHVTSTAYSVAIAKHAGFCHVKTRFAIAGTEVMVAVEGTMLAAKLAALPLASGTDDSSPAHRDNLTQI